MLPLFENIETRIRALRILRLMKKGCTLSDKNDYEQAYDCFSKAAKLGYVRALTFMAMYCHHGNGVPKNDSKAFLILLFSAQEGEPEAKYFLGEFYRLGVGTEVNKSKALYWLQEAAASEVGHSSQLEAQYKFACMLLNGDGLMEPEYEYALYWFNEAANSGYEPAQAYLRGECPLR